MENDAISRSAVLKIMENDLLLHESEVEIVEEICTRVRELPALDVAPVVHAEWIEDGYRGIPCVCSRCGEEAHYKSTFVEQYGYDWNENLVLCGYSESKEYIRSQCCPECGARMDGEDE